MDLTNKQNAYISNNPQVLWASRAWVFLNTPAQTMGLQISPLIIVNSDCAFLQPGVASIRWGNWSDVSIADCSNSILPYPTAS